MVRRGITQGIVGAILVLPVLLAGCDGEGRGGEGLEVRSRPIDADCVSTAGRFPAGLALLSADSELAAVAKFRPPALGVYRLTADRPVEIASRNIGLDSDGDGINDRLASEPLFPCTRNCENREPGVQPAIGALNVDGDHLGWISTSDYEQVLTIDPSTAEAVTVSIAIPDSIPEGRYPLLPAPGTTVDRTGISTFYCVTPEDPTDSLGRTIMPGCDADVPSYLTSFTAGVAKSGGKLFVATSNLVKTQSVYLPGTILVFEWIEEPSSITVRTPVQDSILFTSGFNPTGMTAIETPGGRELVLVTVTGAILAASVPDSALTPSFVDVIDPSVPKIVATIPLGFGGASFNGAAVDSGGLLAWFGSSISRELFAIDLRALDTPELYDGSRTEPVLLDGMTVGFEDARVFTADRPFGIPARVDRPASPACGGWTDVATRFGQSEAIATDYCDGSITRIAYELGGDPPIPIPADRFRIISQSGEFAPTPAVGEISAPNHLAVRQGIPGVDFMTPDVYTLAGLPGQFCGIRIGSL